MASAWFRFYEELNDFLPHAQRKVEFEHRFDRRTSIKDMIESLGVPHPEIELILVNSRSVDFSHIVEDGDRISVYPVFESLDVSSLIRLRPKPLRNPAFIVDCNLGRLARYLRLLGFDCLYRNNYLDADVAMISHQQHRIVLTRDRRLLHQKIIDHGLFVRSTRPKGQVSEVLMRLDLYGLVQPFTRCTRCNGSLMPVPKEAIDELLQPKTRRYYDAFLQCPDCKQVYWQGSHHARTLKLIKEFLEPPADFSADPDG
ncbi:MAG: Mut7-C RNAse domain-containing protein [Gammaproteobacteria bacterium]|nr:MAG: Mut7-C RNAse domain-containing protein [Gammaproteobacteria bacterium]